MRIVFMGTPDYAATILEALLEKHEVCALVCQEDKKAGRDMHLKAPATKQRLQRLNLSIPIFQPSILSDDFVNALKGLSADMIIVAAYGKILPKAVLEIAPCINLHASILPQFRGASPIQQSILEDSLYFGVSAMQMEEGLDCGNILGFKVLKNMGQNALELFSTLAQMAADLTLDYLERYSKITPLQQIEAQSSYCKKIKKEFGLVCFDDARKIERKSLAYAGWPEVFLRSGLKLKGVQVAEFISINKEGEILEITQDKIRIGCMRGSVWIKCLQAPSKKEVSAYQYVQGRRLKLGDILE